jgi:iron complex transport system substrate-binding protein
MQRIVSLLPSSTEIVCALGAGDQLVGRSHECDYPASVVGLPVCTAPKFDPEGSSLEIDQRVKEILRDAVSVYQVDAELLDRLAPDLIVTQSQCEVCAVSLKDVEAAVHQQLSSCPSIVSLQPNFLKDVWDDIGRVAAALDQEEKGRRLRADLQQRLEALQAKTSALPRPKVACLEWFEPLMAAGNWIPQLVQAAGGDNLFGTAGDHSPWLEWEELAAADPDCIVLLPCGFDLERNRTEMAALERHPLWSGLRAVRQGQVYLTDGNQYFNRPGPRLVESVEILAEIFHPEVFGLKDGAWGHRGTGWQHHG